MRPYGDTLDDGAVQLSFTLPMPCSGKAREAARLFVLKLGFETCEIVHATPIAEDCAFFVAYGRTQVEIDPDNIVIGEDVSEESLSFDEANDFIKKHIGRPLVVVGACTGSDAHTVGIDAIFNMKGYKHHFGLERYPMIEAHNLGAQVENDRLIEYCVQAKADAILVSQVVTQKDAHVRNLTELAEMLEAEGLRERFIVIVGGPRISHKLALELGFDAGFGKGAFAEHVATFIARRMAERNKAPNERKPEKRNP